MNKQRYKRVKLPKHAIKTIISIGLLWLALGPLEAQAHITKGGDLAGLNGGSIWYTTDKVNWKNPPGYLTSLAVGDFNGDGVDDLAGLNGGSIWYTTDKVNWKNPPGYLTSLVVGDFNGDGKADLAGLNGRSIWYTTDKVNWKNPPGYLTSLTTGDFNGDGKADLAGLNGGSIWYTTDTVNWKNPPGYLSSLTTGDFNGDGVDDLAGLNGGSIWYTTDKVNWKNPPGYLTSLATGNFNSGSTNGGSASEWLGTWLYPSPPLTLGTGWRYILNNDIAANKIDRLGYAQLYQYYLLGGGWVPFSFSQDIIQWRIEGASLVISAPTLPTKTYKIVRDGKVGNRTLHYVLDPLYGSESAFIQCLTFSCSDIPKLSQ